LIHNFRWLSDEKRFNSFPFKLNKEFGLAIAITTSAFKVAVDGLHLLTYDFRAVKDQLPLAFDNHRHHRIFESLTGFKMFALNGMEVSVSHVDHLKMKDDCEFYEIFSNSSFMP
jgi:hypothetical protein